MNHSTLPLPGLSPVAGKAVLARFDGGLLSSDANGNAAGFVISSRTGARARVGIRYVARFQAYIDDLENNHGARVLFMGGIRPGGC